MQGKTSRKKAVNNKSKKKKTMIIANKKKKHLPQHMLMKKLQMVLFNNRNLRSNMYTLQQNHKLFMSNMRQQRGGAAAMAGNYTNFVNTVPGPDNFDGINFHIGRYGQQLSYVPQGHADNCQYQSTFLIDSHHDVMIRPKANDEKGILYTMVNNQPIYQFCSGKLQKLPGSIIKASYEENYAPQYYTNGANYKFICEIVDVFSYLCVIPGVNSILDSAGVRKYDNAGVKGITKMRTIYGTSTEILRRMREKVNIFFTHLQNVIAHARPAKSVTILPPYCINTTVGRFFPLSGYFSHDLLLYQYFKNKGLNPGFGGTNLINATIPPGGDGNYNIMYTDGNNIALINPVNNQLVVDLGGNLTTYYRYIALYVFKCVWDVVLINIKQEFYYRNPRCTYENQVMFETAYDFLKQLTFVELSDDGRQVLAYHPNHPPPNNSILFSVSQAAFVNEINPPNTGTARSDGNNDSTEFAKYIKNALTNYLGNEANYESTDGELVRLYVSRIFKYSGDTSHLIYALLVRQAFMTTNANMENVSISVYMEEMPLSYRTMLLYNDPDLLGVGGINLFINKLVQYENLVTFKVDNVEGEQADDNNQPDETYIYALKSESWVDIFNNEIASLDRFLKDLPQLFMPDFIFHNQTNSFCGTILQDNIVLGKALLLFKYLNIIIKLPLVSIIRQLCIDTKSAIIQKNENFQVQLHQRLTQYTYGQDNELIAQLITQITSTVNQEQFENDNVNNTEPPPYNKQQYHKLSFELLKVLQNINIPATTLQPDDTSFNNLNSYINNNNDTYSSNSDIDMMKQLFIQTRNTIQKIFGTANQAGQFEASELHKSFQYIINSFNRNNADPDHKYFNESYTYISQILLKYCHTSDTSGVGIYGNDQHTFIDQFNYIKERITKLSAIYDKLDNLSKIITSTSGNNRYRYEVSLSHETIGREQVSPEVVGVIKSKTSGVLSVKNRTIANPDPTKRTEKVPTPFEKLSQFKGLLSKTISSIQDKLSFWGVITNQGHDPVPGIMNNQVTMYRKIVKFTNQTIRVEQGMIINQYKNDMKSLMSIKSLIINIGNKLTELDTKTFKKGKFDNLFTVKRNDKKRGVVGKGVSLIFPQTYLTQHNEEIKELSGIIQSITSLDDLLRQNNLDVSENVIETFNVHLSGLIAVKISKETARDKTIFNWAYNINDDQLDLAFQESSDKSKDKSTNNSDPLQLLEEFKLIKKFCKDNLDTISEQHGGAAASQGEVNQNIRAYELDQYDNFDKHYLVNLLFKSYLSRRGVDETVPHDINMFNLYNLQTYFYSEMISQKYLNYYNVLILNDTLLNINTVGNKYRRCLVFFYVFILLLSPSQRYEWFYDCNMYQRRDNDDNTIYHISLKDGSIHQLNVIFTDQKGQDVVSVSSEYPIQIFYSVRGNDIGRYKAFMIYSELINDRGVTVPIIIKFYLPLRQRLFIDFVEKDIIPCLLNMFSTEDFDNLFSGMKSSICVSNFPPPAPVHVDHILRCHTYTACLNLPIIGINVENINMFQGNIKDMCDRVHHIIKDIDNSATALEEEEIITGKRRIETESERQSQRCRVNEVQGEQDIAVHQLRLPSTQNNQVRPPPPPLET